MPVPKRKSHAKLSSKQSPLLPPATTPNTVVNREEWLDAVSKGFVATGESLRFIYRIILETLWPDGHGIPGPIIDRTDIRAAIDSAKGMAYKDPFRRVRELQGDEGHPSTRHKISVGQPKCFSEETTTYISPR